MSVPTPPQTTESYYNSKWGRIVIFTGDNYTNFSISCRFALSSAGALGIVDGTEDVPANLTTNAGRDWVERRSRGIHILSSSVVPKLASKLLAYLPTRDIARMWDELKLSDKGQDPVHVSGIRDDFQKLVFDPSIQTVRQFVTLMEEKRSLLASSTRPLSEADMREKLINSIKDIPTWEAARQFALRNTVGFEDATTLIQSFEAPLTTIAAASAQFAENKDNKFRGRAGRGRRGRAGRNRGRGGSASENKGRDLSSVRCFNCNKLGHLKREVD